MSWTTEKGPLIYRAAGWAVGIPFTSWRYMSRSTEIEREDQGCPWPMEGFAEPDGEAQNDPELQPASAGHGAAFRRVYSICVSDPLLSAEELMGVVINDPNVACPSEIASFEKTEGAHYAMEEGDQYRVRLPGPWNGPVRVIERSDTSFKLATLKGHMEAGQIEFRARREGDDLMFEIESWARSGDRVFDLLYDRLKISRELQLDMWAHFLERVAQISGGRPGGAIKVRTYRCDDHPL